MHAISSNNPKDYLYMVFMSWSDSIYSVTLKIKLQQSERLAEERSNEDWWRLVQTIVPEKEYAFLQFISNAIIVKNKR
jgi:hypothetical protein